MDLVIDIGNTNTKTALFPEPPGTPPSVLSPTVVVYSGTPVKEQLELLFTDYHDIRNCILSSVIHHPSRINNFLEKRTRLLVMDHSVPLPLTNAYLTPETLGHDRIAAAVAGSTLFPGKDVLVINLGSCIIYDMVTSEGRYTGGAISPGMQMRFKALHTFTGKLPLISPEESDRFVGDSTPTSIASGVMEGITAEIEGFVRKYQTMYPGLQVILSGGDLDHFVNRLKISIFAFPNIVIHGLYQILRFNVDHSF